MTACDYGCTIRGHHRDECQGCDHRTHANCCGCLPRPAEFGRLCPWCWQRLNGDIATAPSLIEHLHEVAEPNAGTKPSSDVKVYRDPAEADLVSPAIDAADEIHAGLASWALLILEERDGVENGPDQTGWWQSKTHTKTDQETGELYVSHRQAVGLRQNDASATRRLVKWLLPHLPWCSEQEWAAEMRREIGQQIATTMARWPTAETRTRHVVGVPCVICDQHSLDYTPAAYFRAQFKVSCSNPDCGKMYTEDEWDARIAKLTVRRGRIA